MSGSLLRKRGLRSIFSASTAGHGRPLPLARKLAWLGPLAPELAAELKQSDWEIVRVPLDDAAGLAIARSGVEVAVIDFEDGTDERVAVIEALIAACHELQWLAVASKSALSLPRVCELIYDQCFDFFIPPLRAAKLVATLGHAWGKTQLLSTARQARAQPDSDLGLVGTSAVMRGVRERLRKYAGFDMPVLLTGETGTGKDVAARAIHSCSTRRQGPFVAINCGALPENLVQSELFGHERGAFTGANTRKIGRIEAAEGGVVFLDEIGDLPLEAQCNLLRFLEARTIERVGGTHPIPVNARVVAATHVDLQRAVREGRFREDLFYRLNVLHVHLPALRERDGDAATLARYFLEQFLLLHPSRVRKFSDVALKAIAAHSWPGNVRELVNRIHSAAVTSDRRLLGPGDLGLAASEPSKSGNLHTAREQAERETIEGHLRASGFNMSECARRLNVSRVTLYRLCRKYRLRIDSAMLPVMLVGMPFAPDPDNSPLLAACFSCARQAARLLLA